jgi:hypothetical protein
MEVGRCARCSRRQRMIMPCTSCTQKFCSSCIQLEVHACSELDARKALEKEKLAKANPIVVASKVQRI